MRRLKPKGFIESSTLGVAIMNGRRGGFAKVDNVFLRLGGFAKVDYRFGYEIGFVSARTIKGRSS
jgi:hypothetical protein